MASKAKKFKEKLFSGKRASERLSLPVEVHYCLPPDTKWIGPLKVEDVGGGGFKFRCGERFKKDTELKVRVKLPDRERALTVGGVIRWCGKAGEGCFAGVQFIGMRDADYARFIDYYSDKLILAHLDDEGELSEK